MGCGQAMSHHARRLSVVKGKGMKFHWQSSQFDFPGRQLLQVRVVIWSHSSKKYSGKKDRLLNSNETPKNGSTWTETWIFRTQIFKETNFAYVRVMKIYNITWSIYAFAGLERTLEHGRQSFDKELVLLVSESASDYFTICIMQMVNFVNQDSD